MAGCPLAARNLTRTHLAGWCELLHDPVSDGRLLNVGRALEARPGKVPLRAGLRYDAYLPDLVGRDFGSRARRRGCHLAAARRTPRRVHRRLAGIRFARMIYCVPNRSHRPDRGTPATRAGIDARPPRAMTRDDRTAEDGAGSTRCRWAYEAVGARRPIELSQLAAGDAPPAARPVRRSGRRTSRGSSELDRGQWVHT